MKILAIDTSTTHSSCAVMEDNNIVGDFSINQSMSHNEILLVMVDEMLKKLNIDKKLSDSLIYRRKDSYAKDILNLINKSKNRDEFSTNIIDYLKLKGKNFYANSLLIGNITGKYNFYDFYLLFLYLPLNLLFVTHFLFQLKLHLSF